MDLSDGIEQWLEDLGLEVVIAKTRACMKIPGLHLLNPTLERIISSCYEALKEGCTTIVIYINELH